MIEDSLRTLAPAEIITDKMGEIIEAFVAFYGEERRNEIEERLNNVLILKVSSVQSLERNIEYVKENIVREVFGLANEEFYNVDGLVDFLTGKINILYGFDAVRKNLFGSKDITDVEIIQKYKNGEYPKLNEFVKKYEEVLKRMEPYINEMNAGKELESTLEQKYTTMLVNEFSYLFSQEDLDYFDKYGFNTDMMNNYFGYSFFPNGHCFDQDSVNILENVDTPEYKKESIISDRLAFLLAHGYDFSNYDECLKDAKCREFIDESIKICTEISKRKAELYKLKEKEFLINWNNYKQCRQIIDSVGYVGKNDDLKPMLYNNPYISICNNNYIRKNGGLVLAPIVIIGGAIYDDCTIIHELNHALEEYTISIDDNRVYDISGWDTDSYEFKEQHDDDKIQYDGISRPYELISEYVNDRLAQEITDKMHEQGNYIYNLRREKETSSYLVVKFLLEDFYTEFKDIIIESRHYGNIQYLFDSIGKENFEVLNKVVNEFYKNFGFGLSGKIAITDYYKKEDNDNTRLIASYVSEKDRILNEMRNCLNNSNNQTR